VGRAITLDLNGSLEVSDGETIGVLEQNTAVDVVQEFTEPSELTEVFTGGARRLIDTNAGYDVTTSFSGLTVRTRTAGGEVRVAYEGSAALNCNVLTNLVTTPVELVFLAGQRCPVAGEIGVYAAGRLVAVVIYTGGGGGRLEFQTGEVQSFDDCGELTSSISACSSAQCGNGIVEFTEQCDGQALANACGLGQSCDETCTCRTFGSVFEAFLKQPDSLL
jgi:hypothetical protein